MKSYDPESRGIVERVNRYLETSFLPGRTFAAPHDFNDQLMQWLPIANSRRVRVLEVGQWTFSTPTEPRC